MTDRDDMNKLRSSLESNKTALEIALTVGTISLLAEQQSVTEGTISDNISFLIQQTDKITLTTAIIDQKIDSLTDLHQDKSNFTAIQLEIAELYNQLSALSCKNASPNIVGFAEQSRSYANLLVASDPQALQSGDIVAIPDKSKVGNNTSHLALAPGLTRFSGLSCCPACHKSLTTLEEASRLQRYQQDQLRSLNELGKRLDDEHQKYEQALAQNAVLQRQMQAVDGLRERLDDERQKNERELPQNAILERQVQDLDELRERLENERQKTKAALTIASTPGRADWEKHLPQSESDGTIRSGIKSIFDHVELHVENFYRNVDVSLSQDMQSRLMQVNSGFLPDSVVGLLLRKKTPTMKATQRSPSCHQILLLSRKQLAASTQTNADKPGPVLLARPHQESSARAGEDRVYIAQRDKNIASAVSMFRAAFAPWATRPNDLGAYQDLVGLMKDAADTGIMIFAHYSSFEYCWAVPNEGGYKGLTRIVLLPGFRKVRDEQARDLSGRAQDLLAPVVGTL